MPVQPADGAAWIERLRGCGVVQDDTVALQSYTDVPIGIGRTAAGRPARLLEIILSGGISARRQSIPHLDCAEILPAPDAIINIERYGGAASRIASTRRPSRIATATIFLASCRSGTIHRRTGPMSIGCRTSWARMTPFLRKQSYVNFLGDEGGAAGARGLWRELRPARRDQGGLRPGRTGCASTRTSSLSLRPRNDPKFR